MNLIHDINSASMKHNLNFILLVCSLVFLGGCKTSKEQVAEDTEKEILLVQNTPEILMVNFSMNAMDSVKIVNSIKNPGKLRGGFDAISDPGEGDLIISFLNDSNVICFKTIVENPLKKKVEYSETDDLSQLTAKTFDLDSAYFSIRVQMDACFKQLRVEKYESEKFKQLGLYQISALF